MESESDSKRSNSIVFWRRLTVDRFDSTLALKMDKFIFDVDQFGFMRGRYHKRKDFLLLAIGYVVGLGNVWRFPLKVYENGGAVFLIPYFIFSFTLGLPMVLLEMGLGQFTSVGCPKVFKCVPILFGIGWSQVVISCITMIYYSVIIAWAYLYLLGSLFQPLPWSSCNNSFNSRKCIVSLKLNEFNRNETIVLSSVEFFHRYVIGFERNNGTHYHMNEFPGAPQWHLLMCLFIVWAVAFLSIMNGVRVSGKVAYFTVLFPYVALFFLFILVCTLPGAAQGLIFYLKPNLTKLGEPMIYLNALEQFFFSLGVCNGGLITLSSHNNFHDNFYRDAIFLVLVDFISSLIGGLVAFPLVGYIAQRTNRSIKDFMNGGYGLFFMVYPEALSTISCSNMWTILFMVMTITVGMDSQFIILETVVTAIGDRFLKIHLKILYRVFGVLVISVLSFLCGLLLITPGGIYYFTILEKTVTLYGLPFIAIMECITIGIIYGHKNFCRDIKMMTGFRLHNYFFISMTYICPLAICVLVLFNIIKRTEIKVHDEPIPIWGHIISYLLLALIVTPVIVGAIHIITRYRSRYKDKTLKQYSNYLIKPPIYYGPQYKVNWLLDKKYKVKLVINRKNPKFLSHVCQYENIKMIYEAIKKSESKKRDKSTKTDNASEALSSIIFKKEKSRAKSVTLRKY